MESKQTSMRTVPSQKGACVAGSECDGPRTCLVSNVHLNKGGAAWAETCPIGWPNVGISKFNTPCNYEW